MTDIIDITIVKGATFKASWFVRDSAGSPVPLAGYSAKMQIRKQNVTLNKENVFDVVKRDNVFNVTLQ